MTAKPWRPFRSRSTPERAAAYDTPVAGIPDYLEPSLYLWVYTNIGTYPHLLPMMERKLRRPIANRHQVGTAVRGLWTSLQSVDEKFEVVDFVLYHLQSILDETPTWSGQQQLVYQVTELHRILTEAGSIWAPSTNPVWGIQTRVDEAAQEQIELVGNLGTEGSREILAAWHDCYKRAPDFESAYTRSVRAVEAAAAPVLCPNDERPSLGKMIAQLRANPAKWTVANLDGASTSSAETLIAMLGLLWENHGRHAGAGGTLPVPPTEAHAQAALALGITLVQWFATGLVSPA